MYVFSSIQWSWHSQLSRGTLHWWFHSTSCYYKIPSLTLPAVFLSRAACLAFWVRLYSRRILNIFHLSSMTSIQPGSRYLAPLSALRVSHVPICCTTCTHCVIIWVCIMDYFLTPRSVSRKIIPLEWSKWYSKLPSFRQDCQIQSRHDYLRSAVFVFRSAQCIVRSAQGVILSAQGVVRSA